MKRLRLLRGARGQTFDPSVTMRFWDGSRQHVEHHNPLQGACHVTLSFVESPSQNSRKRRTVRQPGRGPEDSTSGREGDAGLLTHRGSAPESPLDRSSSERPRSPASLTTLANHLHLSPAAISRVLNGVPAAKSIPQSTQERIFAAAREFEYRPNAVARSLRHGRSMTIGVLLPEISEGYATLVLTGLEAGLLEAGYCFFLISHHHRADILERSQALLLQRSVDGLVAIDTPFSYDGHLPSVTVSCPAGHTGVTDVVLHHELAAELAAGHLAGLGHREVAVIKGQSFSSDTAVRWRATQRAAARFGLMLHPALVAELGDEEPVHDPGYHAAQQLLRTKRRFTALLAFNDISAIGAIRAIREAGLRVPEDVSVVGFDDIQSAAFQNPPLTTIRQPLRRMGRLAADSVVRQIGTSAKPVKANRIVVEPELIVRGSTASPGEGRALPEELQPLLARS